MVAPLTEEATKGAFLLLLLWWRRHELDGVLDGIVYAGMVGIGFAFTENILYLAAAYDGTDGLGPGGTTALTGTFILRCLISPFAHPLFTVFTGIGVGLAITSRRSVVRLLAPVVGFLVAALLHGLWNASTLSGTGHFFLVYGTLMLPALVGVAAFAIYRRRSERPLLTAALQDAADRGLLPATDIPWLDRPARPPARAPLGEGAGRHPGRARDAGVPVGGHRAGLPAPPLPPWHRARRLLRPRPGARRGAAAHPPLHLLPRTGGPDAMTPSIDGSSPAPRPPGVTRPSPRPRW